MCSVLCHIESGARLQPQINTAKNFPATSPFQLLSFLSLTIRHFVQQQRFSEAFPFIAKQSSTPKKKVCERCLCTIKRACPIVAYLLHR
jgi:hypothetical protein